LLWCRSATRRPRSADLVPCALGLGTLVCLTHDARGDACSDELVTVVETRGFADVRAVAAAAGDEVPVDRRRIDDRNDLDPLVDVRLAHPASRQARPVEVAKEQRLIGLAFRQLVRRRLLEDDDTGLALERERGRDPEHVAAHVARLHDVRPPLQHRSRRAAQQPLHGVVARRALEPVDEGGRRLGGDRGRLVAGVLTRAQLAVLRSDARHPTSRDRRSCIVARTRRPTAGSRSTSSLTAPSGNTTSRLGAVATTEAVRGYP
jgi:hypothetical protein